MRFRAKTVLEAIRVAIDEGCSARLLQKTPHVVLLSRKFYHEKLMPLLAQWVLLWMRQRRLREVSDEVTLSPVACPGLVFRLRRRKRVDCVTRAASGTYMRI